MNCESAVTNARFAALHGLLVALFPLADARSTPQIARSSRAAIELAATAAGFRLRSAAALRSAFVPAVSPSPLHFSRSPTADRSLCRYFLRAIRRCSAFRSNNSRVRPTSAASADSFGNAVRYSRTSILLCNPSIA